MEIFGEYIPTFMQAFLDDFAVYRRQNEQLDKCVFRVTSGNLLGHIVSKDGIVVEPNKVREILEAPAPNNAKALSQFLGQIQWHSEML